MNYKGKKVLVTGCSGVIGRHLVRSLLEQGAIVRGIDLNRFPNGYCDKSFDFIQQDLLTLNPIEVLYFEPEIIFHLAAAFERSEENVEFWQNNYLNNLLVSHKVIDMLRYAPSVKKFIFASSYLIYDCGLYTSTNTKAKPVALHEELIRDPRNLTGAAKYYAEKEIEFFAKNLGRQFQFIHARIYRVYGQASKDIISRWVRAGLKGEALTLYGKENCFDYICSSDVACALIKLAQSNYSGVVNVGTGKATAISTVVDCIAKQFKGLKIKTIAHRGKVEKSVADTRLLKKITGWLPQVDIQEGIKSIVAYEQHR